MFQRKSTLGATVTSAIMYPYKNIKNPSKYFYGGMTSFWWPRMRNIAEGKFIPEVFRKYIKPYKLAYQPVKFLLFENNLTRYLDKMWENESTEDTSKVSGKELLIKSASEIDYLKSITDGASAKAPSEIMKDWTDRSVTDIERYGKVAGKKMKVEVKE